MSRASANQLPDAPNATPLAGRLRAMATIAANTFRESIRNKVLRSLLFFAVLIVVSGLVLTQMSLHEEVRVARDLSLFASSLFAMIMAVYSSITLLHTEIERRTVYTILSKPIHRWEFVIGKFLGVLGLMALIVALLWCISAVVVWMAGAKPTAPMGWAYLTLFFQMVIISAIALLLATFSTPLLSGMITVAVFIVGNLFSHLEQAKEMLEKQGGSGGLLIDVVQFILPNLQALNLSNEVTHNIDIPLEYLASALWYTGSYSALVLLLAILIFSRRDFT
ncbi:MAG: ABC transporter permease [Persicimonas sp.]